MKRLLFLCAGLLSAILFSACDADSIKNSIGIHRPDGTGRDPISGEDRDSTISTPTSTIYFCGVNLLPDSTRMLCMYKGNEKVLQLPCNDDNKISSDPDTHFLIGKDLYTTWQGEGKTVISLNGEVLYTFDETEYIKNILIVDNELWSLSANTTKEGFKLRKNGEILLSKMEGEVGELYEDKGKVCFNYSNNVDKIRQFHLVRNGNELSISAPKDYTLMDVRLNNGALWYLEYNSQELRLRSAQSSRTYPKIKGSHISGGELHSGPDNPFCLIRAIGMPNTPRPNKLNYDLIIGLHWATYKYDALISYYYGKQDGAWRVAIEKKDKSVTIYDLTGELEKHFSGMSVFSKRCTTVHENRIYVGISDPEYNKPAIIFSEDNITELKFTGRITGISLVSKT